MARLCFAPRLARRPDIAKYNGADFDPGRSEVSLFTFHRNFLDIYNAALWLHTSSHGYKKRWQVCPVSDACFRHGSLSLASAGVNDGDSFRRDSKQRLGALMMVNRAVVV